MTEGKRMGVRVDRSRLINDLAHGAHDSMNDTLFDGDFVRLDTGEFAVYIGRQQPIFPPIRCKEPLTGTNEIECIITQDGKRLPPDTVWNIAPKNKIR